MKNACIIGFGAIAPVHADALERCENARLYAICDTNTACLDTAGKKYNVITYTNYTEMLKNPNIDTVHICTPHYLHKEMSVNAMLAGKDVVLEKPAAMNRKELAELVSVQKATGKHVCLMMQNRTNAGIVKMKELCNNGELGKITGIFGSLTWNRTARYYQNSSWRGRYDTEGGSLLINQAVHLLDLFGYFGDGIKSVRAISAAMQLDNIIETEDTACAIINLGNGVHGCFFATNTYTADEPFRLELRFGNALLRYADARLYKITDENTEILVNDTVLRDGKKYWGAGHYSVINQFYNSLENGGSYISLDSGLNTMNALFALYESSAMTHTKTIKAVPGPTVSDIK